MRFAPLAVLALTCGGCALFQAVPTQSLDCADATVPDVITNGATLAANAIAGNADASAIEAAAAPLLKEFIACEALALESDATQAETVANANGTDAVTVQAHAKAYLQARSVAVQIAK
jgi:hypothetical protein